MRGMKFITWAVIATLCLGSTGCSYVGYRVGGTLDERKPYMKRVDLDQLDRYDRGTQIDVYTRDGQYLMGELRLLDRAPDDDTVEGLEFFQTLPEPPGIRRLEPDEIEHVEVANSKNARRNLMGLGSIIDAALVGTVVYVLSTR